MTTLLAALGWTAALAALVAVAVLRASTGRRMALVAQAAHELRGPLSAALLGLHGCVPDAAGARRMAGVELELRRAGLALEDLAAAPRGRRAPECAELLDVGAVLADAVQAWEPLAAALAADLVLEPSGPRLLVRADRLRLAQAIGNLVANALEHGAGPVRVRAHAAHAHVRIEIRDQGPGLPGSVARLTAGGPHTSRRGHGLAVAARVAAHHGGRLLSAPVSAGACLVLELPRLDARPLIPRARRLRSR